MADGTESSKDVAAVGGLQDRLVSAVYTIEEWGDHHVFITLSVASPPDSHLTHFIGCQNMYMQLTGVWQAWFSLSFRMPKPFSLF